MDTAVLLVDLYEHGHSIELGDLPSLTAGTAVEEVGPRHVLGGWEVTYIRWYDMEQGVYRIWQVQQHLVSAE